MELESEKIETPLVVTRTFDYEWVCFTFSE